MGTQHCLVRWRLTDTEGSVAPVAWFAGAVEARPVIVGQPLGQTAPPGVEVAVVAVVTRGVRVTVVQVQITLIQRV